METKSNGQTDSDSDYSAYLKVVHNFDTKSLKYCFLLMMSIFIFFNLKYIYCEFQQIFNF